MGEDDRPAGHPPDAQAARRLERVDPAALVDVVDELESLAALRGGARHIQGTLNGLGERCGNANLVSIIPTLLLKPEYADRFETGISLEKLEGLTKISHTLDELLNRAPDRHAPYVGASAFATKAGIHASALMKEPENYEHVPPESVGNRRQVLVSDQAGKSISYS